MVGSKDETDLDRPVLAQHSPRLPGRHETLLEQPDESVGLCPPRLGVNHDTRVGHGVLDLAKHSSMVHRTVGHVSKQDQIVVRQVWRIGGVPIELPAPDRTRPDHAARCVPLGKCQRVWVAVREGDTAPQHRRANARQTQPAAQVDHRQAVQRPAPRQQPCDGNRCWPWLDPIRRLPIPLRVIDPATGTKVPGRIRHDHRNQIGTYGHTQATEVEPAQPRVLLRCWHRHGTISHVRHTLREAERPAQACRLTKSPRTLARNSGDGRPISPPPSRPRDQFPRDRRPHARRSVPTSHNRPHRRATICRLSQAAQSLSQDPVRSAISIRSVFALQSVQGTRSVRDVLADGPR